MSSIDFLSSLVAVFKIEKPEPAQTTQHSSGTEMLCDPKDLQGILDSTSVDLFKMETHLLNPSEK
jgi:hypothetical protein